MRFKKYICLKRKKLSAQMRDNYYNRRIKKYKLGVSYNLFDGEDLLEGSIKSIRNHVDYINVVYQNVSNFGNKSETNLEELLKDLKTKGLIDDFVEYKPTLNKSTPPHHNETNKRNLGLKLAKKQNCTHFMSMDCDEYYKGAEFKKAKDLVYRKNIKCSAVSYYDYIKSNYHYTKRSFTSVPFIFKINHGVELGKGYFPCLADPTRKVKFKGRFYLLPANEIAMHHFTLVRKNLKTKFKNSSMCFTPEEIEKKTHDVIKALQNCDGKTFLGNQITKVENIFNIKDNV